MQIKVVLRSKNTFIFSSDFKTLFTKQSPREILGLSFEKKTVYLNFNFPIYWSGITTPERIYDVSYSTSCVWTQLINYAKHALRLI